MYIILHLVANRGYVGDLKKISPSMFIIYIVVDECEGNMYIRDSFHNIV